MLTLEELQGRHLRLHRSIDGEQSAQGGGRLPISYPGTKHASERVRVQVCVVVSFLEVWRSPGRKELSQRLFFRNKLAETRKVGVLVDILIPNIQIPKFPDFRGKDRLGTILRQRENDGER